MTLRLVTADDRPLVHICEMYGCEWRGQTPNPTGFIAGWIALHPGARMVPMEELDREDD